MKTWLRFTTVTLSVTLLMVACGKKDEESPSSSALPLKKGAAKSADQPAAEAAVTDPAIKESFKQSETAMKTQDYEQAAVSLLQPTMSGKVMTESESWAYNKRMTDLQGSLAAAAARGDARAQKAIELLRASRTVR